MKFTRTLLEKHIGEVDNYFAKPFSIFLNPSATEFEKLFKISSQLKGTLTRKGDLVIWIHRNYPKGLEHEHARHDPLLSAYLNNALYNFYLYRVGARPYASAGGRVVEWSLSDEQWRGLSKSYKSEVVSGLKARIPDLAWAVFGDYVVDVVTGEKYENRSIFKAPKIISQMMRKKK